LEEIVEDLNYSLDSENSTTAKLKKEIESLNSELKSINERKFGNVENKYERSVGSRDGFDNDKKISFLKQDYELLLKELDIVKQKNSLLEDRLKQFY